MNSLRTRIYAVFEREGGNSRIGKGLHIALIVLIALNVLAVTLETVAPIYNRHARWFDLFDLVSVTIFTLEYFSRLWVAAENRRFHGWRGRLRYALTPMAIIDLLAILPFYLTLIFGSDLRFLRAMRLLRVFKLTRYSSAMTILMDVLKEEAGALAACFFVLSVLLTVTASGAYIVERDVQPEVFGSVPESMWWALVTLTTVGYGDVIPITPLGRIYGGIVTVIGVGMAALPAGILASGMSDHLHRRRDDLRHQFRVALQDGNITTEEEKSLETLRKQLGISIRVAKQIRTEVTQLQHLNDIQCPNCGHHIRTQQRNIE